MPYALYYVENDHYMGRRTQDAVVASLNATKVKFIHGNSLTHQETIDGFDVRCYTLNDFMSEFNRLEAERGTERQNYRIEAAKFARDLPFENGCINVLD